MTDWNGWWRDPSCQSLIVLFSFGNRICVGGAGDFSLFLRGTDNLHVITVEAHSFLNMLSSSRNTVA
jgi:hypothetical protein